MSRPRSVTSGADDNLHGSVGADPAAEHPDTMVLAL